MNSGVSQVRQGTQLCNIKDLNIIQSVCVIWKNSAEVVMTSRIT